MQLIEDQRPLSGYLLRIAAIVLGVTIGVQEMMAAFILVPKPITEGTYAQLSDTGRSIYRPERDMPIFLLGSILSLFMALGISKTWCARLHDKKAAASQGEIRDRIAWLFLLALGAMLTNFFLLTPSWMRSISGKQKTYQIALLVLPGFATLVLGVVGVRPGRLSRWVADLLKWVTRPIEGPPGLDARPLERSDRFLDAVWGLTIVVLIVLLAYVPSYGELAGRVFERDKFHHWDFFVVGPALDYKDGRALSIETYSQYGVGYPLLVSSIAGRVELSYGKLIRLGVIYGCVYLVALAVGLRIALVSRLWSSCCVLLCLLLQYFNGVNANSTIWTYPSASILRYAMDVWFFFALVIHCRTGHPLAVVAAGALVGISLLLVLDSGTYLFVAFIGYLACRIILGQVARGKHVAPSSEQLVVAALALTTAAATFSIGLAVASRGLLFHREFWSGYFEPIMNYGSGISSLPISSVPEVKWLIVFSAIVAVYLSFVALLLDGLSRRSAGPMMILAGCLAAYGLGTLLQFVNRSAYQNLFHGIIPFCVLTVGVLAHVSRRVAAQSRQPGVVAVLVPCAVLVLLVFGYAINPAVREYPNLLSRLTSGPSRKGLSLMRDVQGLPSEREGFVHAFREITRRMAKMKALGRRVAVLDWADTMFYVASGVAPADRYCPLLPALLTQKQIAGAERRFANQSFDRVVMQENEYPLAGDAYRALRAIVERDYVLQERIGEYGIWSIRARGALKQSYFRPVQKEQPIR